MENVKIFSGRNSKKLSNQICNYLGFTLNNCEYNTFADGELFIKYIDNIRGQNVFIIQSTNAPSDNFMELLIMIDAAKRASAASIVAVIPYLGYSRQDRKDQSRVPITAKLVANLLERAGADRIITIDLHTPQIQGFYDIPVDHLYGSLIYLNKFEELKISDLSVVSPDVGRLKAARRISRKLNAELVIMDKVHPDYDKTKIVSIIGNVKDKNIVVVDDMIDTGGTFSENVIKLKNEGAKKIYGLITHPVLSGNSQKTIDELPIEKLFVIDTIEFEKKTDKIEVLSCAELLAKAIEITVSNKSITSLFSDQQ